MRNSTATIEEARDELMNLHETHAAKLREPRGGATRFAYPSGSRPLDGYTIKRGIGRGGFGEVYYATSDGGKEVALKLIRRNLDVEVRGVSQCLNLKHPHLLGLYDIKEDDLGDSWVVMEYVAGECLEEAIGRYPQGMPVPQVLAWMHGIAAGVAYLHDHGIVHRDLKPGNIFSDEGLVKIGDYGLSKFISASRRSGQTESVGTVHYMAPEVANGRYGKEIDIYALGIILYEMLTGHVPFEGESVGEVLMKHLTAEPNVSGLAEPFRSVVARALDKDPARRAKTIGEFMHGLPQPASMPVLVHSFPSAGTESDPAPHHASAAVPPLPGPLPAAVALPVVPAELVTSNEEPVWRAIRGTFRNIRGRWENAGLPRPAKVLVLIALLVLLLNLSGILLPMGAVLAVVYFVYYVARALLLANPERGTNATDRPPADASFVRGPSPPIPPHANGAVPPPVIQPAVLQGVPLPSGSPFGDVARKHYREMPQPALPSKQPRERLTELIGSLLMSSIVAAVVSILILIARGVEPRLEQFAWLALVSTAGAWGILVPSKFWEGSEGEPIYRRFVLLLVGLALGAGAWLTADLLMVDLHYDMNGINGSKVRNAGWVSDFYNADGSPRLLAYMPYFGFLFPVLRWWRQTNPLRSTRLSLWSTVLCVAWAMILSVPWPFPQPWGLAVAATVSIAVQLASPWIDPRTVARRTA